MLFYLNNKSLVANELAFKTAGETYYYSFCLLPFRLFERYALWKEKYYQEGMNRWGNQLPDGFPGPPATLCVAL